MIGSLLAVKFYGRKPWMIAAAFWAVYLIIGLLVGTLLVTATVWYAGIIFSFIVFMGLAVYWLRFPPMMGLILFAISYVIDFVIMYGLAMFGISLAVLMRGGT